ncbi:MAG: plasmid pRiA4b ORF-3 family protein [Anaerohalosphaeraceae bacterium]
MKDKIIISLSRSQRDLLLKYESDFFDHDLFRLISIAIRNGKKYDIYLDEDQLDKLLGQISELSNNEENEKWQNSLDNLCDYLEEINDEHEDEKNYSAYSQNTGSVYVLKVALEENAKIWRNIAIRGGQTLHDLHDIIFDAFDRDDEHLYSFYIPDRPFKKRPLRIHDVSVEYTHPFNFDECGYGNVQLFNASETPIQSLDLKEGQQFYYLFDFGDSWWHTITVESTAGQADGEKYPRILERKGKSPEQYEYPDEDDEN